MPLSKKVQVSIGGIHGNCWFAGEDINAGEMIWEAGPYDKDPSLIIHVDTIKTWPQDKQDRFMALAYQVKEGWYSGFPEDENATQVPAETIAENYVNHCCDGNCWYTNDDLLVALRDIKKGEELAYDYALTEAHSEWSLNCLCGKAICRKVVTGNDWKLPELQAKYGNHFLSHINTKIAESK